MINATIATIAIDPGASGGYAIAYNVRPVLGSNSERADKWSGEADFMEELDHLTSDDYLLTAVVEEVPKFVGKLVPSSSIFTLAKNYGWILGALAARGVPTHLVRPQVWQKGLTGVKAAKGAAKKRCLKEHATRLFPDLKPTLATADALLILYYANLNLQGT